MIKGHVLNNSGKSKHIFKQTVFPGQRVNLSAVYSLLSNKVPEDQEFVAWLQASYLPPGWELHVEEFEPEEAVNPAREIVQADKVKPPPVEFDFSALEQQEDDDSRPSLEYAPEKTLDKLTAADIYNLRMKDNPKRVIKNIYSVHKLRRALTLCKADARKSMLSKIIQHRIKDLNHGG